MSLNEQQLAVVNSTANKILCLAGAGAGKTHTMIERLKRLVSLGAKPESILVLTFTNAAAAEMRSRYISDVPDTHIPEFRTFHSFCYSLICSDTVVRNKLGYSDIPIIIDEIEEKRLRTNIVTELSLKISAGALDGTKKTLSPKEQQALTLYEKQFRKYLLKSCKITFDILCYDICKLFKESDESIFPYKVKYKYIFVDEFQDTDPKQWEFVNSFKSSDLFVTGDSCQALYGFRGADSTIIKSLAKSPDWTTYKMDRNYRSTKQICDFANKISRQYADDSTYLKMLSDKSGNPVKTITYQNLDEMYDDIREKLKSLSGTTAILARSNNEVYYITNYLNEKNVEYTTNSSDKHVGYILQSVLDVGFYVDFLASLMDMETYLKYIKLKQIEQPVDIVKFIFDKYSTRYMGYVRDKVERIRRYITDGLSNGESPVKLCIRLIKQFRSDYSGTPIVTNTMTSIINVAIEELDALSKTDSSIYVGTVHSVKGLEYNNVFVTGVGGNAFPLKDEEQNNIYYVACTRAKQHLYVYLYEKGIPNYIKNILREIKSTYEDFDD